MKVRHLETAVLLELCQYSVGKCYKDILCQSLGFKSGKYCKAENLRNSVERLIRAEYKSEEKGRKRRGPLKFNMNMEEKASQNKERQIYKAGAFC